MKNIGVIGLGDMGSGIALNLIKNGFKVFGSEIPQIFKFLIIDPNDQLMFGRFSLHYLLL